MTIKFQFVWIDDLRMRAESFIGALDGSLRNTPVETKLEVIEVTEQLLDDLNQRVDEWLTTPPNLIMLDHNFSTVPKRQFDVHGSAVAHLLRIRLPHIPIVCVSGQSIESDQFNIEDISEYTYLFDVNQINTEANLEQLFSIAQDFHLLCFPDKRSVRQALVDALQPPELDQPALLSVLPGEFEGAYVHGTTPHRIAYWILNVLMKRPGFLYDSLEAATFLGLSESAFLDKVKQQFGASIYKGPFATEAHPLWWASALADVLYESLPDYIALPPQEAGRKFEGIVEEDFSRCAVTNEYTPAPDVVAYTDATRSSRRPVWHSFTIPVSDEAGSILGFSTPLQIRNARREN